MGKQHRTEPSIEEFGVDGKPVEQPKPPAEPEAAEQEAPEVIAPKEEGFKRVTDTSGKPSWCPPFPRGFQIPKGKRPIFIRFRPDWTDRPDLGERICVCWGLSVGEELMADKRSEDSGSRAVHERTKLTIRLIATKGDDELWAVDHSKSVPEADPDVFWSQIGLKCRSLLTNVFIQTHSLNAGERRDFFENCVEVRDAV